MPTAELVKDTLESLEPFRDRAEDLLITGAHNVSLAVSQAVREARDHAPDIELSVPDLHSHKVRRTLVLAGLVAAIVLVVKKVRGHDEPPPAPAA